VTLPPFEHAVREHGAIVHRVCAAIVGPDDADDAWSETFLAALKAYPAIRPDSDVRAWLVTIAHRKAIDSYRARRRAPVPSEIVPDRVAAADVAPDRDDALAGALTAALRALPDKQRVAVVCRYLADMAYRDIAELLGSNEAAARRSAADGIAALRRVHLTDHQKETS
jgi:RNA polymerase sigma factor (sigma-70 family)